MLLDTLIKTAKESFDINQEKLIEVIELLKNEEDVTKEYLISKGIPEENTRGIINLFKSLNIVHIRYAYECDLQEGESEIAGSLKEECIFCENIIQDCNYHLIKELYTLKDTIIKEVEDMEKKALEDVMDNLYLLNFEKLKGELNNIVPFLGSGVSIPLGLPNWTDLISKMIEGLTNPSDTEQFEEYIKEGDIFNAIDILQKESLTYRTEDQIKSFIRDYINKNFRENLEKEYHNINDILELNSDFYVTTNYDSALSHYKNKFSYPFVLNDLKILQELYSEKDQRIIHLHGIVDKKDSMVVTEADYERLYNDEKNKSILSGIMASKSFLFIGFSFTDRYFVDMYKLLRSHIGGDHYIILADLNRHKAQRIIDEGLIPISINVKKLKTEKKFANEINNEYSQRFVNSLKVLIKNLLK
ncbi:hypothetical protein J6TS1_39530 [Siminovitchia terrae]|uniref:SIR2-like domain-containing protein n=1 Tax=Siminovitchia terrae TaxID=1914933 RepID=A0ABQ4L1B6_SIMTE|nr:SIR2 family protein [Siminovitchia terrae]GIN98083.1 hypothetical protein J6TS1_39530 [Siminovitchia terrae]